MDNLDYLPMLQESSLYQEGKVWDKVKKVWRDNKGNIIAGSAIVGLGAIKIANDINSVDNSINKAREDGLKKGYSKKETDKLIRNKLNEMYKD